MSHAMPNRRERGATMVEYILIILLVAMLAWAAIYEFGLELGYRSDDAGSAVETAGGYNSSY